MHSCAYCAGLWRIPRSTRMCRAVGNATKDPSLAALSPSRSVRLTSRDGQRFEERRDTLSVKRHSESQRRHRDGEPCSPSPGHVRRLVGLCGHDPGDGRLASGEYRSTRKLLLDHEHRDSTEHHGLLAAFGALAKTSSRYRGRYRSKGVTPSSVRASSIGRRSSRSQSCAAGINRARRPRT